MACTWLLQLALAWDCHALCVFVHMEFCAFYQLLLTNTAPV